MINFQTGDVKKSIRCYSDYSEDLLASNSSTFDDRFAFFMHFCENDSVFHTIHVQLISNPNVDFDKWFSEVSSTRGSFVGSGSLTFPLNTDDRISVMYLLLVKFQTEEIDFLDFLVNFFAVGSNRISDHISAFQDGVLRILFRELGYKLDEIMEKLPDDNTQMVTPSIIQVIHAGHNVVQQVSLGNHNIQTAVIRENEELGKLLADLRRALEGLDVSIEEKKKSRDLMSAVEEELSKPNPNKTMLQTLFSALPTAANIATLVSAIASIIGITM